MCLKKKVRQITFEPNFRRKLYFICDETNTALGTYPSKFYLYEAKNCG